MRHHPTSEYTLILLQFRGQNQPQSNTPSIKRSFGARVQRFGAIRSSETGNNRGMGGEEQINVL